MQVLRERRPAAICPCHSFDVAARRRSHTISCSLRIAGNIALALTSEWLSVRCQYSHLCKCSTFILKVGPSTIPGATGHMQNIHRHCGIASTRAGVQSKKDCRKYEANTGYARMRAAKRETEAQRSSSALRC